MTKTKLKVAMTVPPWLKMPPSGYGGIEYVVHYLAIELRKLGVQVDLFTTGDTRTPADNNFWYYADGQYRHIHKPLYDSVTIPITQILFAMKHIKNGGYDIIHDHNGFLGPAIMAYANPDEFPPTLHTLHGPFSNDDMVSKGMPDNRPMYSQLEASDQLYFAGISKSQLSYAPKELASRIVGEVHNAIDLAEFPYEAKKSDVFITLARFSRDKGQALAAKLCEELGYNLKMAGIIDGIATPRQLLMELANMSSPYRNNGDFTYYRDEILPRLIPGQIEYVGNVSGSNKMRFIGKAKALLFPIDWEEPFGLAPIEAMACGTPVVAMNRGAMPELIEHGVSGFLANSEAEFKEYMQRVDELDPADCRKRVAENFSSAVMAKRYLSHYHEVIKRAKS